MGGGCLSPEDVDGFLDGKLQGERLEQAEAHLDTCANCRVLVGHLAQESVARKSDALIDTMPSGESGKRVSAAEIASADTGIIDDTASRTVPDRGSRPSGKIRPMRIGRYVVDRKLGEGGMGVVFLADDPELKRNVVIKLLRQDTDPTQLQDRARLLREAQAMAKISHANVVPIFDVGVHDDQVFLAMEFIDGEDLAEWLKTERPIQQVLDVFVAAGRGLAAAHRAGLVHRDFKPHNVMLGKTGEVKVTDFGLARAELPGSVSGKRLSRTGPRVTSSRVGDLAAATLLESPLTKTGALVGSPAYMAPEQILAEFVDARSDQFSFCVALYEALYLQRPFSGQTMKELFDSTLEGKLPEADSRRRVPARVRAALRRGLSVEPADRFAAMEPLLAELAPPRSRTASVAVAVASVALVGGGVAFVMLREPPTVAAACTGEAAEIATVWNPTRRAALEQAFLATKAPMARAAFATLAASVDRYSTEWQADHRDACEATRVRGDQAEDVMSQRMRCLRLRRTELDGLLDAAAKPDDELMTSAASLVARLPSPSECKNVESLAATALPADPKARADVEQIEAELARARVLVATSRIEEATKATTALLARAQRVGHKPLLAELALERGLIDVSAIDWPAAETTLHAAVEAAELAGVDRIRAAAFIQLVGVATALNKLDEADRWARYAQATIERLGKDPGLLAELDQHVAEVFRARGNVKDSETAYRRVIERMSAVHGANSVEVAEVHRELGLLYSEAHEYDKAFAEQEKAHKLFLAVLGPDSPEVASTIGIMAGVRQYQQRPDEAIKLGEQELAMMRAYYGDDHRMLANTYYTHALRLQAAGKTDEAIAMMTRSVEISAKTIGVDKAEYATNLGMLGLMDTQLGKQDEAYDAFARALAIYRRLYGDKHADVVSMLNAMGTVRRRQGRFDEAIKLYTQARDTVKQLQQPDSKTMADTLTRLGTALIEQKKPREAVKELEQALAMRVEAKAAPSLSAWTKYQLARALWDSAGDRKRALELANESAAEAKSDGDQQQLDETTAWLAAHAKK
jgi:tetratricopeptide (TPR) repeat protein/predicted Ser/Thr protein kinase